MKIARNERGFTLIELMVVLIIIGILAAIAIPVMSKQSDKAKNKRAVAELKSMKTIVDIYIADSNLNSTAIAPTEDQPAAVDGVVGGTGDIRRVLQANGVTDAGLADPWGHGYMYDSGTIAAPLKTYILYSKGSDDANTKDEISVTESANPKENDTQSGGIVISGLVK